MLADDSLFLDSLLDERCAEMQHNLFPQIVPGRAIIQYSVNMLHIQVVL